MKKKNKKFIIFALLLIFIAGLIAFIVVKPNISQNPDGSIEESNIQIDKQSQNNEKKDYNPDYEVYRNGIGNISFDIPEGFETEDYTYNDRQSYTNGKDSIIFYSESGSSLSDIQLMYDGEQKKIAGYDGIYYEYSMDGTDFYCFAFITKSSIYTIECSSQKLLENTLKSTNI